MPSAVEAHKILSINMVLFYCSIFINSYKDPEKNRVPELIIS